MGDLLLEIYADLKTFKENLFKLNKNRRIEKVLKEKLEEATAIYNDYIKKAEIIDKQIVEGKIKSTEILKVKEISVRIESLYIRIEEFCKSFFSENLTMEKFNLKTAVGLLPVMTGNEEVTKSLIDSIELYSSMIEKATEPHLIQFILKTRLTESAKMRLSQTYASCDALVKDMRLHLLTKKSSNAIHTQLMRASQLTSTIDEYGKRIEDMFVNLTISQADGDGTKYNILKPINEKLAIKKFTDGLRNNQLSVILAARNYTELKDVIRAAKDEETSGTRSNNEPTIYAGGRGRSTYNFNRSRGHNRGFGRGQNRGNYQNFACRQSRVFSPRGTYSGGNHRNTGRYLNNNYQPRGNYGNYGTRNKNIYFVNSGDNQPNTSNEGQSSMQVPKEFFRQ